MGVTNGNGGRQEPGRDSTSRRKDVVPRRSSHDDTTGVRNARPGDKQSRSSEQIFDFEDHIEDFSKSSIGRSESSRRLEPGERSESGSARVNSRPKKWVSFDIGDDDISLPPYSENELGAQLIKPISGIKGRKTWRDSRNLRLVAHGLQCPKTVGNCEDSPPLFITPLDQSTGPTYLGVFDGMGGAGAGLVKFALGNRISISCTEALLASRLCWRIAVRQITKFEMHHRDDLTKKIKAKLEDAKKSTSLSEGSRIRGTLTKRLPTTLVLSQVLPLDYANKSRITTWWAGDSRAFLTTPENGLAAITRDHVRENDQLDQLRSDPPIENVVNQSTDFYLAETIWEVSGPFVLLLATDGVFGYLPTPGFLEMGLLEALSSKSGDVANIFADFCTTYAADDVSAVMVVSGFRDDRDVADRFRDRLATLRDRYSQILAMTSADPKWNAEVERLWGLERPTYQRFLKDSND